MNGIALTIFDESGLDRVVFSTDTTNQSVRLDGTARWNVFGGIGNINVARGTVIEDYTAGSGNDTVTGNGVANRLIGNGGHDVLSGAGGNDTLEGGAGNDRFYGGAGTDSLVGGTGNDIYYLTDAADLVIEDAGAGTDLVQTGLTHALAANVENLTLTGSAVANGTGNGLANLMVGNEAANNLSGGAGNDTLNGGGGNDTLNGGANVDRLVGGAGNDTYLLGDALDAVFEAADGGTDVVQTGLSYVLGANVEQLVLTGTAAVNGTGNTLANRLIGNSAANVLSGGIGTDTLIGGAGTDTLNGGAGNDVLTGGGDADFFIFAVGGDRDRITDFQDNVDTLRIDDGLFGPGAATWAGLAAVGQAFADRVEFHFAPTQVLTVYGVTQVAQLADDYAFI
jgi:serralysin